MVNKNKTTLFFNADGRKLHADGRGYLRVSALDLRESALKNLFQTFIDTLLNHIKNHLSIKFV
jgi:hypothetical protein